MEEPLMSEDDEIVEQTRVCPFVHLETAPMEFTSYQAFMHHLKTEHTPVEKQMSRTTGLVQRSAWWELGTDLLKPRKYINDMTEDEIMSISEEELNGPKYVDGSAT